MTALEPVRNEDLLFAVLTVGADDRDGENTADEVARRQQNSYRSLVDKWKALQQALSRDFGAFAYVTTLEAHADGWPHMNVIIVSERIAAELRARPHTASDRGDDGKGKRAPKWFRDMVARAGFGYRCSLEHAAGKHETASYVAKFEKGTTPSALGGEVVKLSQLPINAPKRTRILRSSKGFLPRVVKSDDVTGELLRTPTPQDMLEQHRDGVDALEAHVGAPLTRWTSPALEAADRWERFLGRARAVDDVDSWQRKNLARLGGVLSSPLRKQRAEARALHRVHDVVTPWTSAEREQHLEALFRAQEAGELEDRGGFVSLPKLPPSPPRDPAAEAEALQAIAKELHRVRKSGGNVKHEWGLVRADQAIRFNLNQDAHERQMSRLRVVHDADSQDRNG